MQFALPNGQRNTTPYASVTSGTSGTSGTVFVCCTHDGWFPCNSGPVKACGTWVVKINLAQDPGTKPTMGRKYDLDKPVRTQGGEQAGAGAAGAAGAAGGEWLLPLCATLLLVVVAL